MKAKLKVIKNWEFEEFELTGTSFKYSPTGCKGMVARSEDEIVFWTYHFVQKCSGVLWVKGEVSRWIPSPEPKEQQDVWEDPVLLSCDRGILLVCPASKSLWWMPQMDGEWIPIPMDNWCAQGIPKPVAVTGSQGVFPTPREYTDLLFDGIGAALVFNFKRLKREEFDGLKPKIDWSIVESFPFPAPFEEQRYIGDGGKIHVYSWDGRQKKTLVGPYSVRELYLEHFGES